MKQLKVKDLIEALKDLPDNMKIVAVINGEKQKDRVLDVSRYLGTDNWSDGELEIYIKKKTFQPMTAAFLKALIDTVYRLDGKQRYSLFSGEEIPFQEYKVVLKEKWEVIGKTTSYRPYTVSDAEIWDDGELALFCNNDNAEK